MDRKQEALRGSNETPQRQRRAVGTVRDYCASIGWVPITRGTAKDRRTTSARIYATYRSSEHLLLDHAVGALRNVQEIFDGMVRPVSL